MPENSINPEDEDNEKPLCPLCGNPRHAKIKQLKTTSWLLCKFCCFLYCHPPSKVAENIANKFEAQWGKGKDFETQVQERKRIWESFIHRCGSIDKDKINVLDFGSGEGEMLEHLSRTGIKATGLEPSEKGASFSRENGHKVINGFLEKDTFEPETFNIIVIQNMVHYLPKAGETFKILSHILEDNGMIFWQEKQYHFSGLLPWNNLSESNCYSYFSKTSVLNLLSFNGFEVEHYHDRMGEFLLVARKSKVSKPVIKKYFQERLILFLLPATDPLFHYLRRLALFAYRKLLAMGFLKASSKNAIQN